MPDNESMIDELMEEHLDELTPWEFDFLTDLCDEEDIENLSDGRQEKLEEIYKERTK